MALRVGSRRTFVATILTVLVLSAGVGGAVVGSMGANTDAPSARPSVDGQEVNESDVEPASIHDDIIPSEDLEQRVRIHPNDSTLVPGRNYTFSITTNVEVRESLWDQPLEGLFDVFKETSVTDPWLNVSVSGEEATPEITGVVSETDQYNATRRNIAVERVQASTDEFDAGSIHRTLVRIYVPRGTEGLTIRARTGRGDSADTEEKSDVTETYAVGDSLTRWERMAAVAEARAETAAHLNRTYQSMLNTTSVEKIVDQGMRSVFVESAHTIKKIHSLGKATGVAKQFLRYYRSVQSDETFDGPWVGPMIQATNDMWESGREQMALTDVREAGNSSETLERLHRLASEEATAWRAHDRATAREKLTTQENIVDLKTNSREGELYYEAQTQEREASLEDRVPEGVRVYFEGLMSFSLAKSDEIEGILAKTRVPDPNVTLRNPTEVREQLGEEGTVRATFELSNDGKSGPTSVYGFLSLAYSNDTLDLTGIRQVDEEADGEVLRDTPFRAANLGEYTNDTLTNTYVAGKEPVLTRDGDREYLGRTVTDVYERFEPGEQNVYEVTFERTGPTDAPANLSYRLAFQPFVHEPANQSEFVRAPTSVSAAQRGAQGWRVYDISAGDGGDDPDPTGRFTDVDPGDLPGSGTEADPYVLTNASELQAMADDLDADYVLGNDIDASGTAVWNDGRGFKPVGSNPFDGGDGFTGTFDGAGHRITGLTIDRSDGGHVALFGGVDDAGGSTVGAVENVYLVDVNITGGVGVSGAALVGINDGTVREAVATGTVSGAEGAGGLVRTNIGRMEDAYASVNVTADGSSTGGGLVALNDAGGTIRTSYATGTVTGDGGGFVGENFGTVTDAYWDRESSGRSFSDAGTGLTTDEMTGNAAQTTMTGFDFPGTWRTLTGAYPALAWQDSAPNVAPVAADEAYNATENGVLSVGPPGVLANDTDPDGDALSVTAIVDRPANGTLAIDADGSFEYTPDPDFHGRDAFTYEVSDPEEGTDQATVTLTVKRNTTFVDVDPADLPGSGTEADPYVISNASELQVMADAPGAHYELGSDVDASGTAEWNDDRGFDPIGDDPGVGLAFDGSFDGAGHTISNLSINRSGENYVGLFGYVSDGRYLPLPALSNATIENVTLLNATVTGSEYVGGLVGFSSAAVKDASVAGTVDGNGSVGGLIGFIQAGAKVARTSAGGSVAGTELVGGLVGDSRGTILRSSATGAVTGSETEVGGLAGRSTGTLKQSYATGAVTGAEEVGGLVGHSNVGVIDQSYAVGSVTGTGDRGVGGLVGDNAFTPVHRSFWDTDATGQAASDGGTGLTTARMTGDDARGNMTGFDFDGTWAASPGGYPELAMGDAYEPPALADDSYQVTRNATLSIGPPGVLANDTDPDGDALSVAAVINRPANGTLAIDADGSFEYVPETGFVGRDTFTYVANADGGGTEVATVKISVTYPVAIVGPDDLAGEGTPESPYVVTNASELQAMEDDLDAHYVLGSDIDASGTGTWHDGRGFDPVGSSSFSGGAPFDGSFDGAGHVITGLTIDRSGTDYVGLFGWVGLDGSVENVTLSGGSIVGADATGGLAGFVNGNVTGSGARVTVTGDRGVGGLVGSVGYAGLVTRSFANGSTVAGVDAGGLVGKNSGGTVAESYATGAVEGGGVTGGLVGRNDREGTVRESWAAGTVTGSRSVGGLVGTNEATVNASYWDMDVTGQEESAGGTGLTTAVMTGNAAKTNMTGFAFGSVWRTRPIGYPVLEMQPTDPIEPPQASFVVSPESPEAGTTVLFDASGATDPDGTIRSYDWNLTGDGSADKTGTTVSHTYTAAGEYDVTLTVTDDDGATNATSTTVSVVESNTGPQPSVSVSPENPTVGSSITFDASDSTDPDGSIVSYDWDLTGDGSADATGETVSYTYSGGGDYDVTLTLTDDDGATATTTTTVTARDPNTGPEASFTVTPNSPEVGSTIAFDASGSTDPDGTITSYEWDLFDDGSVDATGSTASVAYSEAGEYTVSLVVSDDDGATAETTRVVAVNAPPTAQLSVAPTDPEAGREVSFTASASTDPDGTIETYQWDLTGDGNVDQTGAEVTRTYQSSGEFQITLTVTDDDGSRAQERIELTVQPGRTTTTPGDTETTAPGDTETTAPGDTESEETTSPETRTEGSQGTDDAGTPSQETPGFGIGAAVAGIGGAGYIFKRRLEFEDDKD
jgi:PGF-CTERM protein